MQNLAGKVTLALTPKVELPCLVGHGAFTNVWQGRYRAEKDAMPVSHLIAFGPTMSTAAILLSTDFGCGEDF
jgi:hypothetical protein